jgi:ABC-2 type transport system permease protein
MSTVGIGDGPGAGSTGAAPAGLGLTGSLRALRAQAAAELRLTLRRGDAVLLTLAIPVGLLVFFSVVQVLPKPVGVRHDVTFLAPGILALAVMSTAMVSLGIATGFERHYGVLKRLGATPLGRPALLAAKTASTVGVEILQMVVLVAVAVALGWRPQGDPALAVGAVALATVAFAGLGLLMAGALRAEVTLAAANGLYLALLLLGGMVFPLSELPGGLRQVAEALPAGALSQALHGSLGAGAGVPLHAWLVLAAWAVAAPLAAARTFRWE